MPMKAAAEVRASLRWCQASAFTAVLATSFPTRNTQRERIALITITPTSTARVKGAGMWWGVRISRTASTEIPAAAPISISATTAAASDSALPYPKG